jgi:tetratricopeptide (TPR) repeat protein
MTRLCFAVTWLLAVLFSPAQAQSAPEDYNEARRLFAQASYAAALDRVESFLKGQPKDARGRFLKGLILTEQGKQPEAIKVFTALTEDYPELPEPYNNLAVLYAAQGQDDKARKALEAAIRTHPTYATAHENLGDIYAKMAREAYDKALQLDSSNTSARAKLALVKELFSTKPAGQALVKGTVPEPPSSSVTVAAGPVTTAPAPSVATPAAKSAAAVPPKPPAPESTPSSAAAAPAKAAPAPEPKARDVNPQEDVLRAVEGWARAWSNGEASDYLGYYAPDFRLPKGQSRAAWEQSRRERVVKGKRIQVQVTNPKVTFASPEEAIVTFRQIYQSSTMKANTMKKLTLVRTGGRWLIQQEETGR